MPAFTAGITRGASGFNSSSDGPTFAAAPASASVWQSAHGGVASLTNNRRPAPSPSPPSATGGERSHPRPPKQNRKPKAPSPSSDRELERVRAPAAIQISTDIFRRRFN